MDLERVKQKLKITLIDVGHPKQELYTSDFSDRVENHVFLLEHTGIIDKIYVIL